ncbi:hypothetical protein LSUE1_G007726, partial [Lachnellula suecica]
RSSRRPSHAKSKEPPTAQPEATWPPISFLFSINPLPVNEEPSNGGVAPRSDQHGRWLPPLYQAGFATQGAATLYRWQNGIITPAPGYQWYNGAWWWGNRAAATFYRANTMFYCNPFDHFLAAQGDVSMRDMATAPFPNDRWYTFNFHHDEYALSRLDLGGAEPYLAGNGPRFIEQLGIGSWRNPDTDAPISGGLAGNLALLIALIAFSCRSQNLDNVLRTSWQNYQWRGHNHGSGRRERRGMVVSIYLDPENPQYSTTQTISDLEWTGGSLLL